MALITSANARAMAKKANDARRALALTRRNLTELYLDLARKVSALAAKPAEIVDTRLARVREQLDILDARILFELKSPDLDGQKLNWLASAQEKLSEQERVLAGRPLPGSRRPGADKPVAQVNHAGPADE